MRDVGAPKVLFFFLFSASSKSWITRAPFCSIFFAIITSSFILLGSQLLRLQAICVYKNIAILPRVASGWLFFCLIICLLCLFVLVTPPQIPSRHSKAIFLFSTFPQKLHVVVHGHQFFHVDLVHPSLAVSSFHLLSRFVFRVQLLAEGLTFVWMFRSPVRWI